jgi:transglutaminase-like putative cysteine protease
MYSSIKLYTISMPALEKGAIIDWQVTISEKESDGTEQPPSFDGIWYFARNLPAQESQITVQLPKGVPLRWQARGLDLQPTIQTDSETVRYTFSQEDVDAIGYEPYMPDLYALSPQVVISTLDDWDDIASWYSDLAADRYKADDAILAKVQELTDGIQTESKKISAIYDFVAGKVRYVALELGMGRYQPHPATEVFTNRYGDCKDQATLLISLLRATGFEAYPVLLNVRDGMDVDFSMLPTAQVFDHVIAAVRQEDGWLFLDPTCDICTASYLPQQDQGKHGLLIVGKEDKPGIIVETDPYVPEKTYVKSETQASISEDGDLTATAKIITGGDNDLWYRSLLLSYRPDERRNLFGQILSAVIPRAQITSLDNSDLDDTYTPVTVTEAFKKEGFAQKAGGMLLFAAPYPAQLPFPSFFSDEVGQTSRKYPLMTVPERMETQTWITIPAGMSAQLPEDKTVKNEIASFSAHYELTGDKILATRVFQVNTDEVPPAKYPLYKEAVDAMLEDANAMIVLKSGRR